MGHTVGETPDKDRKRLQVIYTKEFAARAFPKAVLRNSEKILNII
jgi:hypothetical protein